MVDDKEPTNGHLYDFNCTLMPKTEATGGLLLDGSSGGVSGSDGGSSEGIRIYTRRKRRKMSNWSSEFDQKIKGAGGSVSEQDNQVLSFDAISNGPGEGSLRHCSNNVLQPTHQQVNGHKDGNGGYHQDNGSVSVNKKTRDSQTFSSGPEVPHVMSCGLKQTEGSTSSELCWDALSDIINSGKFSELRGLLLKNFGVANVNQVLGIDPISLKIKDKVYETSPIHYLKDIQQVWTKLQQVGNEMVTLATSLSDKSRTHYEQFVRKPRAAEAHGCQGCGEKADVKNCLVCDSCEDIYHLSCSELVGTKIPSNNWYCTSCVSNGLGSPHNNCLVCKKLKGAASIPPLVNDVPTNNQSQDVPNGLNRHLHDVDEKQISHICFICKSEVNVTDKYRTCGHLLCAHKYYHDKCLNSKQLTVYGSCWYCPSCLCRRCLVDKDDDQIVLCDCCDDAYHIYCASPQLLSIPDGSWYCRKCDRELQRLRTMRRKYESMQKKVKVEDGSEKEEYEEAMNEREGIDMLVTAAKTLSNQDTLWKTRSNVS